MTTKNGFSTRAITFDEAEKVSKVLALNFLDDRFTSYITGATTKPPRTVDSPEGQALAFQFKLFIQSTVLDGGRTVIAFKHTEDGEEIIGGIAVWFPPGKRVDVFSWWRMIWWGSWWLIFRWGWDLLKRAEEFHHDTDKVFVQAFGERFKATGVKLDPSDTWHLQLITAVKEFEGKGLMSLLQREGFRHAVETAAAKGEKPKPICLEATSERARDRYAFLGYELAPNQPLVVGKGQVDENGLKTSNEAGATGIKVYCMVNWEPNPDYKRPQ
ncbi:hypothetical protein VNI00_000321 [Paramarasmius palmivorus]|uniref:N-acetyltransferase domain-containing protein n=1 Tax=Paramarasmius palmivorus TaxID=297713 RepID=A0AAW0EGD0_9AGAR